MLIPFLRNFMTLKPTLLYSTYVGIGSPWSVFHCSQNVWPWMTSKRDSRCFMLALAPDASASTRLPCLTYISVPLSTCRYVSKFTAASRGSPCDSTAFLIHVYLVSIRIMSLVVYLGCALLISSSHVSRVLTLSIAVLFAIALFTGRLRMIAGRRCVVNFVCRIWQAPKCLLFCGCGDQCYFSPTSTSLDQLETPNWAASLMTVECGLGHGWCC